ncbi:MAG TPA: NUDIX domain-containing protein, partial [Candidatus Kapabacteria bacterium]|nr:NUDIX domain-containing protein [Candidatus Kapabacteria bacterium]
ELNEELGVQPMECYVLPIVNSFYHARRHTIAHSVIFAARITPETELRLSPEHSAYFWCTPSEAQNKLIMPSHIEGVHVLCDHILHEEKKKYLTRIV